MSENGFPHPVQRLVMVISDPVGALRGLDVDKIAWIVPVLLVSLLMVLPPQLMPKLYLERQIEAMEKMIDSGLLTEEQAFDARQKYADSTDERGIGTIALQMSLGIVSQFVLRYLLTAALLLAGLRFVMEGKAHFATVLNVVAFSSVPAGLRELIRIPLMMAEGSLDIFFSPAALTGTASMSGYALNLLDLFDLWIIALLIVGVATIGNGSRARAAGLVIPLWVVFSLLKIGIKASPFGAAL